MQFYYMKCGSKNINPSADRLCILCSDFVGIKYLHTIIFRTDLNTDPIQNIFTLDILFRVDSLYNFTNMKSLKANSIFKQEIKYGPQQ